MTTYNNEVSQEAFYAYVNPRNIHVAAERMQCVWTVGYTRHVIGWSTPGYMCEGPKAYFLTDEARAALV